MFWTIRMFPNSAWNLVIWFTEKSLNFCNQVSDFVAKMHRIQFQLRLHPRPHWGAYSARFKGPGLLLRDGSGRVGNERGEEIRGKGRGGDPQRLVPTPCPKSWKIPWSQKWSDWWGRQHQHLPWVTKTLMPPLTPVLQLCYSTVSVTFHYFSDSWKS